MKPELPLKKIEWLKGSRRALKEFPDEARYQAGSELLRVQQGKHLPIGSRCLPLVQAQ